MHLFSTVAIVTVMIYSNNVSHQDVYDVEMRLLLMIVAILLPSILKRRMSSLTSSRNLDSTTLKNLSRIHFVSWFACCLLILGPLKWIEIVRYELGLDGCFLIDELLILIPFVLSWDIADLIRQIIKPKSSDVFWQNAKMQSLALIPVSAILLTQDIGSAWEPFRQIEKPIYVVIIAGTPFVLPWMLAAIWRFQPIPVGPLRDAVVETVGQAETRFSQMLVWNSQNRLTNAAVCGLIPRLRYLLISDGLIEKLSTQELRAIVAHEAAHVKNRHLIYSCLSILLPCLSVVILNQMLNLGSSTDALNHLLILVAMFCWLLMHRFVCRCFEHHADIEACRILSSIDNKTFDTDSVHEYSSALQKLNFGDDDDSDWWHPSTGFRVHLLENCSSDPSVLQALELRISTIQRSILGSVAFLSLVASGLVLIHL